MLVAERHQQIVELVNKRKSIRVSELSRIFSVTEETIRRDLEKLEGESKLNRSHGGALRKENTERNEIPYFEREVINTNEKKEIALMAAKQIKSGDKVILDASSTAWYMSKVLKNIPITVVTNSIKVAMELSTKQQITVISIGGTLLSKSLSFVGPLAESSMNNYHVNKAFISCQSFHVDFGISDSNELQARVKQNMIECAEEVYIMVDHTKIGQQSFAYINKTNVIDKVITDSKISNTHLKQIEESSLQLIKGNGDCDLQTLKII